MRNKTYIVSRQFKNNKLARNIPLSTLLKLDIELTERCNNNCIHCGINLAADNLAAKKKELSTQQIQNILKQAVALGCLTVRFTGGEPLLREDFQKIYIFARRLGLKVILFTNATLITPNLAQLFSKVPPLKKIEITVYGMKKSSYEGVSRVNGSFTAAWRGINLLLERRIPFVVKNALLPPNKNEVSDFFEWAKKLPEMHSDLPAYSMFFNLRYRRNEEKNKNIKNLRICAQEGLKILTRDKKWYIQEMKKFCAKFMHPVGDRLFSCGSGVNSGCVDAYGYFQPCLTLRHPKYSYDLKQGSLKDALINFFPIMKEEKAKNPVYLKRCAQCFLMGLCNQCPAQSWLEHGTLDTPVDYLCDVAHAQARFLGLLGQEEMGWDVLNWPGRIKKFIDS